MFLCDTVLGWAGVLAGVLMLSGCRAGVEVHGEIEVIAMRNEWLMNGALESVNGTYGAGCAGHTGSWSVGVAPDAMLDHGELSVALGNVACVLTLTELHTAGGAIAADPAIVLTTSYAPSASAFSDPVAFYANAKMDSVDFSADFVVTILYSDEPSVAMFDNVAFCRVADSQPPVDLGTAGSYVLLAESGITNVTGSSISGGDLGVSPIAASAITGFALMLDPSGVYSTSSSVVPPAKIYAADYASPTPSTLTSAVLDMQAAYTDAAGRTPTDYLDLNGGDIGGLTLGPGLYTWDSTVVIPEDVTLEGCTDDVWIFQISDTLDVSTGTSVILSGGARARNVFWQVAGQTTINAEANMVGVLLSMTGITLQTAASLHGRALAQTFIALDDNAVTAP